MLPLLFLWFGLQNCKCNPRLWGFKEVRCETCGLASLGDVGQGTLDASVTSGRAGGSRGGRWKAWQKACALAGMRDQGRGGGTAFLTRGQLESLKRRRRKGKGNVIPSTRERRKTQEKDVAKFCRSAIGFQLLLQQHCFAVICLKCWEF